MADLALSARLRSKTGRKVHALRRSGDVPAVLYGHGREPLNVAVGSKELQRVWRRAGHSHLVDLAVEGGSTEKVLIRDLQTDPRTSSLLHADFFTVNLREKLMVEVPVVLVGDAPAVTDTKVGQLQHVVTQLRVECLPADLPAHISVDITGLDEVEAAIHLKDLDLPKGVALAPGTDEEELIVKIVPMRVAAEEPGDAGAETAGDATGEAAAEGSTSGSEEPGR